MQYSHKYFENRDCEYYPCHKGTDSINCLFCYCAMYNYDDCPGDPIYREKDGKVIKSCVNCTFPHLPENYEKITEFLKSHRS